MEEAGKTSDTDEDAMFHYVSYVPVSGSIWELDGLKRGPGRIGKQAGIRSCIAIHQELYKLFFPFQIMITSTIGG